MNPISLNSTAIAQPMSDGGVNEELKQIFHQRMLVDGSLVRHFYGLKWYATLVWDALNPTDYATIIDMVTTGSTIDYGNSASGVSFTGFPMQTESPYLPGSTLLRKLTLTIQEA